MPYIKGVATDYHDLLAQLITWVTDSTIHGDEAWELMRHEPWPKGTILRSKGLGENDHFYIGLMPLEVVPGKTYQDWLSDSDVMGSKIIWSPRYLNMSGKDYTTGKMSAVIDMSGPWAKPEDKKYAYFSFAAEVFEHPAKVMFMGAFKQYDKDLNWDELPGGLDLEKPACLLTQHAYLDNADMLWEPPLMPGLGSPAFGMNMEHPIDGKLHYYFIKDRCRITIVTNHYDAPLKNEEYWDIGHIGLLVPFGTQTRKTEIPFPAVVIGPTSGAWSKGINDAMGGAIFTNVGAVFDFTYKNWALTRGIPTYPTTTKADKNALSQVIAHLPSGKWANVCNWTQGTRVIPIPNGGGACRFANDKPVQPTNMEVYLRPTKTEIEKTHHIYDTTPEDPLHPTMTFQLEPLEIIDASLTDGNMLGYVKGIYWPSVKPKEYGEVIINGEKCLMLPNCWIDRRWHIPDQDTQIIEPIALKTEYDLITLQSRPMNCLIKLED